MAKSQKMGWQARIALSMGACAAVLFLPSTVIILVGMLPTIMARIIDRTPERTKVLTVGFMNFAGVFPYWYELLEIGHKFDNALHILSSPLNIVVMYAAAFAGYVIEWGVTGVVAGLMIQKGRGRLDGIKKAQEGLIRQWGPEVSGEIPLNQYGFPVETK